MSEDTIKQIMEKINEERALFFNKGISEGVKHTQPSNKTMEEINNIKVTMEGITTNLANIKETVDRVEEKFDKHVEKEENFIATADNKYASKTTINYLVGAIITIITGVTVAIVIAALNHVFK